MSEVHAHVQARPLPLATTLVLVVTALVYVCGWLRVRNSFPNLIPAWRLATFISGLFSLWICVASPLAALDHQSLTIHMAKHLLLMTVAAPLVLAGAPVLPLLYGFPRRFIQVEQLFGKRAVRWLGERLKHPVLYWLAGTTAVIGWHLPAAFQLAIRSHWVHRVEDGCFLVAGLLFWWPVLQTSSSVLRAPRWSMALYLFLATLPCDILSAFLVFCNRVVYSTYLSTPQFVGRSPLQDQEYAGALMWVWTTFAYLIPVVVITMEILSPPNKCPNTTVEPAWHSIAARPLNDTELEVI